MKMEAEIGVMGLPVKEFQFFWRLEESGNTLTMFVSVSPHSPAPNLYVEALWHFEVVGKLGGVIRLR